MNKLASPQNQSINKSANGENKVIALNQNAATAFPASIGQALDAYLAQFTDAVLALRNEVLQIQQQPAATDEADKLLTANQTAEMLGLCRQTVFDYAKRGLLVSHRLGGRTYFKQGEVVAALRTQQQPTGRRKQPRKTR